MKILVTGATGFIGKAVIKILTDHKHETISIIRKTKNITHSAIKSSKTVSTIGPNTEWANILTNIDVVIHLAGRAHIMRESSNDPLTAYRQINFLGTKRLANAAGKSGVKKFVFISSVKAGDCHLASTRGANSQVALENNAYGISKLEGEKAVIKAAQLYHMDWVVLRSPLVYGPGVKGNFLSLLKAIANGWFLPFGSITNQRSLIYLENLADAILCSVTKNEIGGTYCVTDGSPVSTPELIGNIAKAFGRSPRLISIPPEVLQLAGLVLGKNKEMQRLLESSIFDDQKFRRDGNWIPPISMATGLERTVQWYQCSFKRGFS